MMSSSSLKENLSSMSSDCYHCGDHIGRQAVHFDQKDFCCLGCKTVYEIFKDNQLTHYYELENRPGITPTSEASNYAYLDDPDVIEKIVEFDESGVQVVNLLIPTIHCSSCIWVLENLQRIHKGVLSSQVNFPEKTVRISFKKDKLSIRELVLLLGKIGYAPYLSLEDMDQPKRSVNHRLIYQLGVAGFAFGNIMFLSFPEYFEVGEFWLEKFKYLFRWLILAFSLPVVFYSAQDYFKSAWKGLRSGMLNIDVPIALGIAVLFIRSTIDIVFDLGTGFFDSLTGLVFFLLVGKFFQHKTYSYLSFERDYRSYFPIGVTCIDPEDGTERQVQVRDIEVGDRVLIRNQELIPVDGVIYQGQGLIDYSFVTGESLPVSRQKGELLYAGGRQQGGAIEIEVSKAIDQSYLTKLWQHEVFDHGSGSVFKSLTDSISKRFTYAILTIAVLAGTFWLFYDPSNLWQVVTAVLIVACPCAIALSAPFTQGNLLRILGRRDCFIKDAQTVERMSEIDTIIFDKTGTLTTSDQQEVSYQGKDLSTQEYSLLNSSLRASNHPLSRKLYDLLDKHQILTMDQFEEQVGKGISASSDELQMRIGSLDFVKSDQSEAGKMDEKSLNQTAVHISSNNDYLGHFTFHNTYRNGMSKLFDELQDKYRLIVLSGDNDGERSRLEALLPVGTGLFFNRRPDDKLEFVDNLQQQGRKVMMIGDGLNDAGALAQSDVGLALAEDINVFTPACDGILDARRLVELPQIMKLAVDGRKIIQWSFIFSLIYNLVGLGFAVTGHLAPVVAAILMPLSSISIVIFTTVMTRWAGAKWKAAERSKTD